MNTRYSELNQLTIKSLHILCKDKGIKGYSKFRKHDLINYIMNTSPKNPVLPPSTLKTEDLGKTAEYALCLLYGVEYIGNFKYDLERANRLKDRFEGVKDILKIKDFVGKTNNYSDFILEDGSGLSVKSNKCKSYKIAPQIIGQTTKHKFKEHFNCDDRIKVFIKEKLDK